MPRSKLVSGEYSSNTLQHFFSKERKLTPSYRNKAAGNAAVFMVYWYIVNFAVTWGPLAWVVSAEVFPRKWIFDNFR